jgi:hypothetical protein
MMIDTLEYTKRLEAAGVPRPQAEAHAAAVRDTLAGRLATKADIDRLEQFTKADINRLEQSTKADVALLKADLDTAVQRFETLLWKHTAGIILTLIGTQVAVGGVLLRFLR